MLAVLTHHRLACTAGKGQVGDDWFVIAGEQDIQFLGLGAAFLCVNLSVIGVAEHSVLCDAQEPYGMRLEVSDSLRLFAHGLGVATVYVHAATIAFAQEVECFPVGTDHRVAVFSGKFCHIGMLAALGIIEPYVACNRGGVMLAPLIFATLAVLIEKALPVRCKTEHLNRRPHHLQGTAAPYRNLI